MNKCEENAPSNVYKRTLKRVLSVRQLEISQQLSLAVKKILFFKLVTLFWRWARFFWGWSRFFGGGRPIPISPFVLCQRYHPSPREKLDFPGLIFQEGRPRPIPPFVFCHKVWTKVNTSIFFLTNFRYFCMFVLSGEESAGRGPNEEKRFS